MLCCAPVDPSLAAMQTLLAKTPCLVARAELPLCVKHWRSLVFAQRLRRNPKMRWFNRILASVKADLTSDITEAEAALLSASQASALLKRVETELQAALAKAQAAKRRVEKLQNALIAGKPADVSAISQLAHEQKTAKSFEAHANQLSEVRRRVKSALPSGTPKKIKPSEHKP
jgi:hypothetical protein